MWCITSFAGKLLVAEERAQVAEAQYERHLSRESLYVEQLRELLVQTLSYSEGGGEGKGDSGQVGDVRLGLETGLETGLGLGFGLGRKDCGAVGLGKGSHAIHVAPQDTKRAKQTQAGKWTTSIGLVVVAFLMLESGT